MQNTQIMVVNSHPEKCHDLFGFLKKEFNVISAVNGEQAVALSKIESPDIILLDDSLSAKSATELCRRLKACSKNSPSVVMLLEDACEQKVLESYSAGADDFLIKGGKDVALLEKLKRIRYAIDEKNNLKSRADFASQTAFHSMSEASQYGNVLRFIKDSFRCRNHDELVDSFFSCMDSLQLNSSVQIRQSGNVDTYCSSGVKAEPIEEEILLLLKNRGRIFDFNQRTVINEAHVSILIRNMPMDNPDNYGRLRDTVAVLVEGFESRVVLLQEESALKRVLTELADTIHRLDSMFDAHEGKTIAVMDILMVNMRNAFDCLALTEEQENHFTNLVESSMNELIELHIGGRSIEDEFSKILKMVKECLS